MSLIGKNLEDFKVQAYHNGNFKEVSKEDVLGNWGIFFSIQQISHLFAQLN